MTEKRRKDIELLTYYLENYWAFRGPVSEAINWAYVARTYFGKSRGWLYQRMNGNIHNGAVARFSATEAAILEDALWDIAEKIRGVKITKVD